MATLMEKDVLLELVMGAYVTVLNSSNKDENDLTSLLELKRNLYALRENKIDYRQTADFIKTIRAKYE